MPSELAQVYLSLFSRLGLIQGSDLVPFTVSEWKLLERKIDLAGFQPVWLLGKSAEEIQKGLNLSELEGVRLAKLLDRTTSLPFELERLASRGIHVVTRADSEYPRRYLERLKDGAPALLYYSGESALLGQPGIAVVGSRHLDESGQACAEFVGNACGLSGLVLYSGGAKGVDTLSMNAALSARGTAVGIVADSLEKTIREPDNRSAIQRGDLCLATPYSPSAPFSVGNAMGRNRLIYTLADYAIVVASDVEKGGTWAGATEALRARWVPVFVLEHPAMPEGNRMLLKKGALAFPHPFQEKPLKLQDWMESHITPAKPDPTQLGLF